MTVKHSSNIVSQLTKVSPIIISLILLIIGIALNLLLKALAEDQLSLFVIGDMTPNIMVKILYITWTIGAIGIPLSTYYVFFNEKKIPLAITIVTCLIILPICMYFGAADEAYIVGSDVVGYEIYSDGSHKLFVKIMNSGGECNYQSFYIQDGKYHCTWKNSGTIEAPIVWSADHVAVLVNDQEIFSYNLDEFYNIN